MDKNDTIVTNIVIQALRMDDTIKRQEVIIERLKSDKNELLGIILKMKTILNNYSPELTDQFGLFNL